MRLTIGILILILVFAILAYSDFFLTKFIKIIIKETNNQSRKSYNFTPINREKFIVFSTIFWIPSSYLLLIINIFVEYKIIILFLYLLTISSLLYYYIAKQSSKEIAKKSLPIIVFFSIPCGIIIVPLLAALKTYVGTS
jgi:hypothetical protein